MPFLQLALGFVLATLIGFISYRRGSLSKSGVAGAILIGTIIFGLGGWGWGIVLIAFFISSSALSHFKEARKATLAEKFSKGHHRDFAQTLANGGAGALIVILNFFFPHPVWWVMYVGVIATVNADTWATELGVLSNDKPKLITTGKEVETGTSGGVTVGGVQAALAGAALISIIGAGFYWINGGDFGGVVTLANLGAFAGVAGSLFDSGMGATIQAIYYCDACAKETERYPTHTCGNPTKHVRGWRWLDNDWVNFLSSVMGGVLVAMLWFLAGV